MLTLGIDIGSRSVKTVLFDAATGMVRHSAIRDVSPDPARDAQSALAHTLAEAGITAQCIARTVSTGYGRYSVPFASASATEITCHAEGVAALFPDARLVIDIGGQDSKVIRLSAGKVRDFAMNDRCAAGTGRFLEVAARILDTTVDGMAELAERATEHPDISSMCVVFAESEILGMIAKGVRPADIALGLHIALARRVTGLVQRCGVDSPVVFTGGVALNRAMARAIGSELKDRVSVADEPRLTGALGAALIAARALGAAAVLRSSEGLGRKPAASKCAPVPCPVPAPASACSCECASPARPAPCAGSGSVKQDRKSVV